jgi:hypothetical protein
MIAVSSFVAQLVHQREDLRLDRDVERRGRLVGDQHRGPQDSAMAIITRWRMPPDSSCGYSRRAGRLGDVHQAQHLGRALQRLPAVMPLMQRDRLGKLLADGQHRIERGHRLLEDHRDLVAADLAHLGSLSFEQVAALVTGCEPPPKRAGGIGSRRMIDSEVTLLPHPDSPDDAEHLARHNRRSSGRPRL